MRKPSVKQVPAHTNNYSKNQYKKTGIVLHWIVGTLESAGRTFQDPNRRASTHYGIGDQGEIHQFVDDKYTAFHAGVASYNQKYFGIEHEGGYLVNGKRVKPSVKCHESSARLVAWLCKTYNIPCDREHIIGHNKTGYATSCPGSLDIDLIISKASSILGNNNMWSIDEKIRDNAEKHLKQFYETYRPDVLKAGVDTVLWWVEYGSDWVTDRYFVLSDQLDNKTKQADKLQRYYNQVVDEKKVIEEDLSRAKSTISTQQNTIEKLKRDLSVKEKQSATQAQEILQNIKEIKRLSDALKEKEGVLEALQSENGEMVQQVSELENENKKLREAIEMDENLLRKELSDCRSVRMSLEKELKHFREFKESLFFRAYVFFQDKIKPLFNKIK